VPGLLVSVRSAAEARAAVEGGATVVDIKEPDRGPLGRAGADVWAAVRAEVPRPIPVSVALGELAEWEATTTPGAASWSGIAYRKLGLAGLGPCWAEAWARARAGEPTPGPPWIAVVYADWVEASAPDPSAVLDVALGVPDCVGILVDTWDKGRPGALDEEAWFPVVARAKAAGRLVTLAGGLDAAAIRRLAPLGPDLFGVRGAACVGGDRRAAIDPARVACLARFVRSLGV